MTQRPAVAGLQPAVTRTNPAHAQKVEPGLAHTVVANTLALGGQLPNILVALLTPAALVALAMGLWRVGADLDWAGEFPIVAGFFSHWQVWIALSIALKLISSSLLAWERRMRKTPEENPPMF
jgi:hypothetical protein